MSGREAVVLPIGRKALDAFRSAGIARHTEAYAEAAEITVGECFSVAKTVAKAFREGVYREVYLVYTHFVSVLSQSPKSMKLLPLEAPVDGEPVQIKSDTVYEPSLEEVFDAIVPEYLGGILYGAVCESRCAEQAARRTAMDSATQNAEDMIADLTLKYNRARQAAITQEITEIVAGTNA
jgi:F-type H+-transporting ATPase subunit gamma